MSQETVALVVERLLTDRNFRNEFALEPLNTLIGVQREGRELTSTETVALVQADRKMWFWPDEKQGLETLRNVLVAFEKNRARQSSLHAAARIAANAARPAWDESNAGLGNFTGVDRVTPLVPALSAVEGPRSWVFDGGGSPTTDQSLPARRRGVRWLLLALLCFVLAFVLGFATGIAHAAPRDPDTLFVKRVIATEGDRVRIVDGRVYLNDVPMRDDFLPPEYRSHDDYGPIAVRTGCYFVMGDHRNVSSDSRHWGEVPKKYIVGKVQLRWWPLPQARIF